MFEYLIYIFLIFGLLGLVLILYLIFRDKEYYEKEKKRIAESYAMGEYLD